MIRLVWFRAAVLVSLLGLAQTGTAPAAKPPLGPGQSKPRPPDSEPEKDRTELQTARKQIAEGEQALAKARKELSTLRNTLEDTRRSLRRAQDELAATRKELLKERHAATHAQQERAQARKLLADQTAEREAARKERDEARILQKALQARLEQAERERAKGRDMLTAIQAQMADTRKALEEVVRVRAGLQKALSNSRERQQLAEARADTVAKDLSQVQEKLKTIRKELGQAMSTRESTLRELAAERERNTAAASALKEAGGKLEHVQAKLRMAEARAAVAEKDLTVSRAQLTDFSRPLPLRGRARFLVEVPSPEARLYIDGKLLEPGQGKIIREFVTVNLRPGKHYVLSLKAEMVQDGQPVATTRQVEFEADSERRLYLGLPADTPGAAKTNDPHK